MAEVGGSPAEAEKEVIGWKSSKACRAAKREERRVIREDRDGCRHALDCWRTGEKASSADITVKNAYPYNLASSSGFGLETF